MKLTRNIALIMATLAFGAAPAVAIASGNSKSANAPGHTKTTKTDTKSNTSSSTKAYGRYCKSQNESKKRVPGDTLKGTPFSQCVVALAKVAKNSKINPTTACKGMSGKHVAGSSSKGTPFSECVVAAAKLRASSH